MERHLVDRGRGRPDRRGAADDILDLVKVEAEPPIIKSENRLQEAQADQILLRRRDEQETLAARHGLV